MELAHRYLKHHLKSPASLHEVRITVDSNQLNNAVDKNGGSISARSTIESHQSMSFFAIISGGFYLKAYKEYG